VADDDGAVSEPEPSGPAVVKSELKEGKQGTMDYYHY